VVRKMVAGMLTTDGYRVLAASSPKQGLKLAREENRPVQLVVTIREDGGEKLCRELHARQPNLRVLCLGHHDSPASLDWLPPERQAALAKPFALSEVLRCVRALLDA